MTTSIKQESSECGLEKLNGDDNQNVEYCSSKFKKDDDTDTDGNISMDVDANYCYLSSKSIVKVEPLPEIPQSKRTIPAEVISGSVKKFKTELNEVKILKSKDGAAEDTTEDISSETANKETVHEFVENEQDSGDPVEDRAKIKIAKKAIPQDPASFSCTLCSYQTNKKLLLSSHLRKHSDTRPYKCDRCEKRFKSKDGLKKHIYIHLGHKPHVCTTCDKAFTTSQQLKSHERWRHMSIKPIKCTECDYRCVEESLLRIHMRSHTGERPFKCPHCTYAARQKSLLNRHMKSHTDEKPYHCPQCTYAARQKSVLNIHMKSHTDEKPYKCPHCTYAGREKRKLRSHMRSHTGERPYQCPHCTYDAVDSCKLKIHIRSHTGEKPYECDICPARYANSHSLKNHRHLVHSEGEKQVFQCNMCPTSCKWEKSLRIHMQTMHSSDQPIPCKECGKEFPDRYTYKIHIKTHRGEKGWRCEYCPYEPKSRDSLKIHSLIHLEENHTCRVETNGTVVKISAPDKNEEQNIIDKEIKKEVFDEAEVCIGGNNIQYAYDECRTEEYQEHIEGVQYDEPQEGNCQITSIIDVKQEELQPMVIDETSIQRKDITVKGDEVPEAIKKEVFEEAEVYNKEEIRQYDYIEEGMCDELQEGNYQKTILVDIKPEEVQSVLIDETSLQRKDINVKREEKADIKIMA